MSRDAETTTGPDAAATTGAPSADRAGAATTEPAAGTAEPAEGAGPAVDADIGAAAPGPGSGAGRRLDPDRLALLDEERDFLLRSLDDLEREHDAGDVDDHDYETLRDDYTARAAAVIRSISSHEHRAASARRPRSWRRAVLTVAGVVVFAVVAGLLVAQASGRREAGDSLTGDVRQSTRTQLSEAVQLANTGDYEGAVEIYDDVLDEDPDNAEALAYKGWFLFLDGDAAGIDSLIAATEADPEFPDTHAFLAVILERAGRPAEALAALDRLDALDPPAGIVELVAPVRARAEAQLAGASGADGAPSGTTDAGGSGGS